MPAFRSAWTKGADGVELDVQCAADGAVVVFHDHDGQRLAGREATIHALNSHALSDWRIRGEPIPLLADVLAAAPTDALTMIELKGGTDDVEKLGRVIAGYRSKNISLLTFRDDVARLATGLGVPVWLNVEPDQINRLSHVLDAAQQICLAGLSVGWSSQLARQHIDAIHDARMGAAVWTVNEPATARMLKSWNIDILMTDDPGLIRSGMVDAPQK